MTVHFNGPVLNHEKGQNSNSQRAWFSNLPVGNDPDYTVFYEDFIRAIDTTNDWAIVKDTGAAAAQVADALNGEWALTSTATTDNDGSSIQTVHEAWKLEDDKRLWFEARVKVSDADDMDAFVGLSLNFATNPEAVLAATDRVGFQIDDGNASILVKTEKDGTETSTDTGKDAADATYVKLGFYFDGGFVHFYVNRSWVASHTTNIPDDENLSVSLFELSGSNTGTKSMTVDYVMVVKER